jgi:hypothetical protein
MSQIPAFPSRPFASSSSDTDLKDDDIEGDSGEVGT